MYYQRTKKIEDRFKKAADLLRGEGMTLNEATKELGVSRPTFFRMMAELRRRHFMIRAIRENAEFKYQIIWRIDPATHKVI